MTSNCVLSSVGNPDRRMHAIVLQDNSVNMCVHVFLDAQYRKKKKSNWRHVDIDVFVVDEISM